MIMNQLNCRGVGAFIRTITTFPRFTEYLSTRRQQATQSLLIQVLNLNSVEEVRTYLQSTFGPLEAVYHYSLPKNGRGTASVPVSTSGDNSWLLAEFANPESAVEAVAQCRHAEGALPFSSAICWYHQGQPKSRKKQKRQKIEEDVKPSEIFSERGERTTPPGKTVNDQLKALESSSKLSELGIRLRFFVASQLELTFRSFFPSGCVLPFGSTVSGIGRHSGDLDLVLLPYSSEIFTEPHSEETRLIYQSKLAIANSANSRFQSQRLMETVADVIQLFVPGCAHVQRILQARVPILRFRNVFTDLQCDLSMTNSSGVHMSELIYIMGQLEPRFPTLVFAIRSWASAAKVTNPVPGRQPTNFMLVLLLIHFLQRRHLLPSLEILFRNAGPNDQRVTADGIDCSFLRDRDQILSHFTPQTQGESEAELLFAFFEFYSEFDFNSNGVSLLTGSSCAKPDGSPLYIRNPLERQLNVARNVSMEELTRFQTKAKEFLNLTRSSPSWEDLLLDSGRRIRSPVASKQDQRFQIKELFT